MSQSTLITIVLAVIIIAIFLVDYLKKRKEDSLEKSVEKFVEKENLNKSFFNLKSVYFIYFISLFIIFPLVEFLITGKIGFNVYLESNPDIILSGPIGRFFAHFLFSLPVLLFVINFKYDNWILKRKKNFSISIILIPFFKVCFHYFFYSETYIKYHFPNIPKYSTNYPPNYKAP